MARIFIDSFETQDLNLWDTNSGGSIVSTSGLSLKNDYCLSVAVSGYLEKSSSSALSEIRFAFQWRTKTITSTTYALEFYDGASLCFQIYVSGTNLRINSGYTNSTIGTHTIASNTTYFLQGYFKRSITSNGRMYLKVNGIVDIDDTKRTSNTATTFNKTRCGRNSYFDNIVLDSTSIPEQTEIALLKPNAIGNSSNWTPSVGNNYDCVDEVPYSDADYNSVDAINVVDTFGLENLPGLAASIKSVQVQARVRRDVDAVPTEANLVLRTDADYHGTDTSVDTTYDNITHIWEDNPADSQPFEKSDIDSIEVGIRSRT